MSIGAIQPDDLERAFGGIRWHNLRTWFIADPPLPRIGPTLAEEVLEIVRGPRPLTRWHRLMGT